MSTSLQVGMDVVRVTHIASSLEAFGDQFLHGVFTRDEIAQSKRQHAGRIMHALAARFAAKQAVMKLLGDGTMMTWQNIEVKLHPDGSSYLELRGAAATQARGRGLSAFALQLSDDGDYAVATVVASIACDGDHDDTAAARQAGRGRRGP